MRSAQALLLERRLEGAQRCWPGQRPPACWPREIGFGNGGEFKKEFSQLCKNMGLIEKTSLPWNPQSNAILERIHQILADCLRACELEGKEIDPTEEDPFEEELAAAAYAIRCGFHATHGHSPGELVFGRNMFLPVEAPVDWEELKQRKQKAIAKPSQ